MTTILITARQSRNALEKSGGILKNFRRDCVLFVYLFSFHLTTLLIFKAIGSVLKND
jgi:hypothetical protein